MFVSAGSKLGDAVEFNSESGPVEARASNLKKDVPDRGREDAGESETTGCCGSGPQPAGLQGARAQPAPFSLCWMWSNRVRGVSALYLAVAQT